MSLYSRTIGAIATDMKSQEEAVGKALWHQVTTVVILRENMRQKKQSTEDGKLRTCLENMRYKACTPDDIAFLRTRVSSSVPGRPSICHKLFRDVSIITSTNLHKDEINRLGAARFAQETGQSLTDFFSDDSPRVTGTQADSEEGKGVKRVAELTSEMKDGLWSQPPSSTDKHIAGKLSLCIGLPVMIRYNFAMEMCMTRGQEGFVHGWQSKTGSSGQLVLDTLFIKLKDPPSCVHVPGLPENVVPVYPTTTNVRVMLPNDEKYYVARTQVEVLVNFAMTDFASQGKTRPYNVSDLNNLKSHQSYYTALSRSAMAEGTLILQGFDPRQIVGGCSGALRQDFRELELLDNVTRLRYSGKLLVSVDGDTRNNIITSFREWKGAQYVPSSTHSSIKWSKRSPWLETEVLDLDERLAVLEKLKEKKNKEKSTASLKLDSNPSLSAKKVVTDLGHGKPSTQKRRRSSETRVRSAASTHQANRQKLQGQHNILAGRIYATAPIGMRWSQNSCAYDSIFTPIYYALSRWCAYGDTWTEEIQRTGSTTAVQLIEGFIRFKEGLGSLEDARDKVRQTLARTHRGCAYGSYTSMDTVCSAWFKTSKVVLERFYQCPYGHRVHHSNDYSAYFSTMASCDSISQWLLIDTARTSVLCEICDHSVGIRLKFCSCPPILAFELSGPRTFIDHALSMQVENRVQRYVLAAVVYYAHEHFTSQIVTCDGRVWFYDGMSVARQKSPTLEHVGSINDMSFDMKSCRGGSPCLVLYTRV